MTNKISGAHGWLGNFLDLTTSLIGVNEGGPVPYYLHRYYILLLFWLCTKGSAQQ